MGTRKKCEHGTFIGYDDKVKDNRVFVKRIKKVLASRHVQSINSAKKSIYKDLQAIDDVHIDTSLTQRAYRVQVNMDRVFLVAKKLKMTYTLV
uniref:Uncharacterized protein n=1 Tax=Peronospora matthiolae TaxID=2874970 RepID=A0AAV1TG40_9STRA